MAPGAGTAAARPWPCLPPAFDQGRRLHALPNPEVYWLEIMLRQHELCWRAPTTPHELRVALFGSSAVYGLPLPVEETLGGYLNRHFADAGIPAHLFNLAFVTPYQVRDALLINEALPYEPNVIVYPMTLAEFRHLAPMPYPTFSRLFDMNNAALQRLAVDPPAGLEAPVAMYAEAAEKRAEQRHATDQLRDAGLYARLLTHAKAEALAARVNAPRPRFKSRATKGAKDYKCSETERTMNSYTNWKDWNVLAYLEDLQRRRGIRVLVVHWPIAHEPLGNCYSVRYTTAAVNDFSEWIRSETERRQLAYLDLRDLLPNEGFIDSLHPTAQGHRQIADRLAPALDPMLRDLVARRTRASDATR